MTVAPPLIARPSPNFNARDSAVPLSLVVLHYTGMATAEAALDRLCDPRAEVSAHYVIDEQGQTFQLVDEAARAWHAGKSFWRGVRDVNSASIGIELVNPGHAFGYRPFPAPQIAALKMRLHDLMRRHGLPAAALVGHSDVAVGRKDDPGELFPWEDLAQEGLGLWPRPKAQDDGPATNDEVQGWLRALGYEVAADAPLSTALLAFQRHYHPKNLTGTPDAETLARLRALLRGATDRP